jgi:hypothetical protein
MPGSGDLGSAAAAVLIGGASGAMVAAVLDNKQRDGLATCRLRRGSPVFHAMQREALKHSTLKQEQNMKRFMLAVLLSTFALGSALADDTCQSKAVGKDGKPLAGAALASFLKKCKADACEPKAVSADGKPLAGAAKASFLKKCEDAA